MELSVIIPARDEDFLFNTVQSVLGAIQADTEIIVVLDGEWSASGAPVHPRVKVIKLPEPVGQRAAINIGVRASKATYVMKLDAHCAVGPGFDKIMIEDMKPGYTMVPRMYNLHVFDWTCDKCGSRWYQGRQPKHCMVKADPKGRMTKENPHCDNTTDFTKEIVWEPNASPDSTAMRFDRDLRFQYWGGYKEFQKGDVVETMSLLGACFMMSREQYWALGGSDEKHGSWGQQGTEIACKTWLSGGQLMCNKKTWFAHLFRTQGGDFGFPYPNPYSDIEKARAYSKDLWLNDKWPLAKHKLSWLIDKFNPPDWDMTKGIIYYTDNRLSPDLESLVQQQLYASAQGKRIISVSLKPIGFGENIAMDLERGYLTMFKQILAGLEGLDTDVVFFCEHDVLYHHTHFNFTPPRNDTYYYNTNVWKYGVKEKKAYRVNDCRQTSGLVGNRKLLIEHYKKRIAMVEKDGFSRKMGFEPGTHRRPERVDDFISEAFESEWPNVDLRHDKNLTETRWSPEEFRNKKYTEGWMEATRVPGWEKLGDMI